MCLHHEPRRCTRNRAWNFLRKPRNRLEGRCDIFCPLLPEGHTKILSIRSDGASPDSTALIIRGPKSWSQGAGMISPCETTKGRQNSRAGRQALTNMAEVPNPTVREPWQKLKKCFMNWRTSRADQVLTAQALLRERPTRHPWFLRLLLLIGLSSTPAWISSAIRMG